LAKKVVQKRVENECPNMKFYIAALVVIVAIVSIFALYVGTNYSGSAVYKRPGEGCFIDNDLCQYGCELNIGDDREGTCRGAPLGGQCGTDNDCEKSRCDIISGVCGGKNAFCRKNTECLSGTCLVNYRLSGKVLNNVCA